MDQLKMLCGKLFTIFVIVKMLHLRILKEFKTVQLLRASQLFIAQSAGAVEYTELFD